MTYPPIRYTAPTGAVSATFRPAGTPPDLVGHRTEVGYLATRLSTDGEFGLYHYAMTGPGGPDPHFHRTISESFYVLTGIVRLYDGARWVDATAGDFLHVPVGGIHAFRNDSGNPAAMLLLFAPGAPRERYFEELAQRAVSGRLVPDEERVEFLRRNDQYEVPSADPGHSREPSTSAGAHPMVREITGTGGGVDTGTV